ncbi:MAG: DUF4157 domain-containing protein [Thermoflexales bacterium]|nr:DUF4157 domain-containing protein [Thermoflexales bacterium]
MSLRQHTTGTDRAQRPARPAVVARAAADTATGDVLQLQRAFGNRAVTQLQRQPTQGGELAAPISSAINRTRGGGQPLPDGVRGSMESAFQSDFGGVRVHTDQSADTLNRSVQAKAFTLGHDIYFRKGNYQPGHAKGQELLAHELTHVVQQGGSSNHVQGKLTVGAVGDRYEQEADRAEHQFRQQPQSQINLPTRASQPVIQRKLNLDTSWDVGLLSWPVSLGGTDWAGIKRTLIADFDTVESTVDDLKIYAFEIPQVTTYGELKGFVTRLNKQPPPYTTWEAYQTLRGDLDAKLVTATDLKRYVKENKVTTKQEKHEARDRERQAEKEERARLAAEKQELKVEKAAQAKKERKKDKDEARKAKQAAAARRAQELEAELARSRIRGTTSNWNNEVIDAMVQLNPRSRTDPNIMNHPVNQAAVTDRLPALPADSQWIQVRTTLSGSDNHFRVFVEVAGNEPVADGMVAVARGLSHQDVRDVGNFWCYARVGRGAWTHQSGQNPYNL